MRSPIVAGALGLALCGGCQATRRGATWEDVPPPVHTSTSALTTTIATAPPAPAGAPPANADDGATAGQLIDQALMRFTDERAKARRQGQNSGLWHRAWGDVLRTIDDAVTRAPVASDLGAFVRARVTLDVELVTDRRREVMLPEDLEARVQRTFLGVDASVQELRAANAPGTSLASMPRFHDGDLVLRAPLSPMIVSSPFGRRHDPFTSAVRYHSGVDLDASEGSSIYAAASGIVVYAGPQGGYGRYIVLDHGDGVRTHYAHLSKINTEVGALVVEGDVIGFVGSTGRSTGPHLHFAVTDDLGAFLDPMAVLDVPFDSLKEQVATRPGPRVSQN